jgi:outer membrane receptor protein involved in Fe transport
MKKNALASAVSTHARLGGKSIGRWLALPMLLGAMTAGAEESKKEVGEIKLLDLEEVVVTGTPGGAGVRKLDASFAITTVDEEAIKQFSPKSTADLFKTIPGVWVESSGGVSGANIFVRGFPSTGDADFVTVQVEGAPIYPPSTLSFLENSTLFRIDETIDGMEALRGGPNPVFSNGQPGLTTNFRLKQGGEETEGILKYSTSDYDLQRVDGMISGKIAPEFYYMVGGYVTRSPGIRDAEFDSEEGHQLTINLTKEWGSGKANFYHRNTDDHGTWYLPVPLEAPGVDAGTFTYVGNTTKKRAVTVNANGDQIVYDFSQGRGWDGSVTGFNIEHDFADGWTVRNRFNVTSGDANTYGLVPSGGAVPMSELAAGLTATTEFSDRTLDGDDWVQAVGFWVVEKDIESKSNDFSVSKTLDDHTITAGYYWSKYSADDVWSLGNQVAFEVRANGEPLTGIGCSDIPGAGCWAYGIDSTGETETKAFYIADEWQINDDWRIDAGIRRETADTDYRVDSGPGYADGSIDTDRSLSDSKTSGTLGVNYTLNEDSGIFGRIGRGFRFPTFDMIREGQEVVQEIDQYELGYKFSGDTFGLFATFFYNDFTGLNFTPFPGAPTQQSGAEAYGVELDAQYDNGENFRVSVNATLQSTELTDTVAENEGNSAPRQPDWQIRISPSYDFHMAGMEGTLYGTLTAVDDRFGDNGNSQDLPGYEKVDLGVILRVNEQVTLQLVGDNMTDEEGLTEGDPRITGNAAGNGRTILGRSYVFSASYEF